MVQELRAVAITKETSVWLPAPTWLFITFCNFSSQVSRTLIWPSRPWHACSTQILVETKHHKIILFTKVQPERSSLIWKTTNVGLTLSSCLLNTLVPVTLRILSIDDISTHFNGISTRCSQVPIRVALVLWNVFGILKYKHLLLFKTGHMPKLSFIIN